jgi:NAD(P)H-flavin reductase
MNGTTPVMAQIDSVRQLSTDTSLYTLRTKSGHPVAASFGPGQFLELSLPGIGEVPVSYCGIPSVDGVVELCIRHAGRVTNALKSALAGDTVGLRGPFGHGFPMAAYKNQHMILIAGGLGIAPLRSLLLALVKQSVQQERLTLLYAAREAAALIFLDELQVLLARGEISMKLAVDRPGSGPLPPDCRVALLPDLLDGITIDPEWSCAAMCGPPVVYPHLAVGLRSHGMQDHRMHFSLERRMKCGVGRCGHCAVGVRLCCIDGPVFSYAQLADIDGALG